MPEIYGIGNSNLGDCWLALNFLLRTSQGNEETVFLSRFSSKGSDIGDIITPLIPLIDSKGKISITDLAPTTPVSDIEGLIYPFLYYPTCVKWTETNNHVVAFETGPGPYDISPIEIDQIRKALPECNFAQVDVKNDLVSTIKTLSESEVFICPDKELCHVALSVGIPTFIHSGRSYNPLKHSGRRPSTFKNIEAMIKGIKKIISRTPATGPAEQIVGDWEAYHRDWIGFIRFMKNGLFVGGQVDTNGIWFLEGKKLTIDWFCWNTEALMYQGENDFKGTKMIRLVKSPPWGEKKIGLREVSHKNNFKLQNLVHGTTPAIVHCNAKGSDPYAYNMYDKLIDGGFSSNDKWPTEDLTVISPVPLDGSGVRDFETSLRNHGVRCITAPCGSHRQKMEVLRDTPVSTKYVLFSDMFDVVAIENPMQAVDVLRCRVGCKALFCSEKNQFPEGFQTLNFEQSKSCRPFCFLNSGIVVAETEFIQSLLKSETEIIEDRSNESDQWRWKLLYQKHYPKIQIDDRCEAFQCLYSVTEDEVLCEVTKKGVIELTDNIDSIMFIHVKNYKNTGDIYSSPHRYYRWDYRCEVKDLENNTIPSRSQVVIVGGGGLNGKTYSPLLNMILGHTPYVIVWGTGSQNPQGNPSENPVWMKKASLVGVRDEIKGRLWVPCASCKHPVFDSTFSTKNDVSIYEHQDRPIDIPNLPKCKNNVTIEQAVKFIGESKTIITNSYHGAYWATLLGRRVLIYKPWSNKFDFMRYRHPSCEEHFQHQLNDTVVYPEALKECRDVNDAYFGRVNSLIRSWTREIK